MNAPLRTSRKGMGDNIAPRHKSVARMIGFALAADDVETWQKVPCVLHCRLSPLERGSLALMALMSLPDEDFDAVIRAALGMGRATA